MASSETKIVQETVNPGPAKRTRSSLSDCLFDFKKHWIFCDTECFEKDPKTPREVGFIIKWGQLLGQTKIDLSKVCSLQKDSQSAAVKNRVKSALSDLHAMDAMCHLDCKEAFFCDGYLDFIWSSSQKKKDYAVLDVIKTMDEDKSVSWNSIEL